MIRIEKKLRCGQAKRLFSSYLDGAVTGNEMLALQYHMAECADCDSQYQSLRRTQQLLASVGRPKVPADLGLNLRLMISREVAQANRPPFEGLFMRLENAVRTHMLPAAAGFVSAVIIFGVAMMYFVSPATLTASEDVPLVMVNTGPEMQPSALVSMDTINADSLVIEAYVGANGRVEDYRILSDTSDSERVLPEVKRMLIFTTFRPALSMGRPMPSRAVLSFSKVSVRG
jgi:hypothetical protein